MKTWQKWAVGIGMILAALGGWAAATFDGDPTTNQSIGATVDGVKAGVNVITSGDTAATAQ